MNIQFTDAERVILANQYHILAALNPDSEEHYRKLASHVQNGFEWLYKQEFDFMAPAMPDEDARLVVDILSLYANLKQSYGELTDKGAIKETDLKFDGFDGNHDVESNLMCFTDALAEEGRFSDVVTKGDGCNSHYEALPGYQRMLDAWRAMGQPRNSLSLEQIEKILQAKRSA